MNVAIKLIDDRGFRAHPEAEHKRQTSDEGEAKRVERMEVERTPDIDPLGAVVHLMEPAPQERRVVHRSVPGIDARLQQQEAAGDLCPERQRIGGEQPVLPKPSVPEQRRVGR